MSRAGRRARRDRLIAAGQWQPSSVLADIERQQQDNRARVLIAERDAWIRESGLEGWQREQNRRRAERNARLRAARLERRRAELEDLADLMREPPRPGRGDDDTEEISA